MPFFTEQWYRNEDGKKIQVIPANISNLLTPIAMAYWLSGDCHYNKTQGAIEIYTDSFTTAEVDRLRSILLA